jgi:formylmethanofuran dehydrogenase subunit E
MPTFEELLQISASRHQHLCPRQVLGVRMGLLGGKLLGLEVPQTGKRLLTIVETDGCGADGLAVAAGCYTGRRTMRILDFGKMAATMVDTATGRAIRLIPSTASRSLAHKYAPNAENRWEAYLLAYQHIPDELLFAVQEVRLTFSLEQLLSKHGLRVNCDVCGEEILNEREIKIEGITMCRACAGNRYYQPLETEPAVPITDLAHLVGF